MRQYAQYMQIDVINGRNIDANGCIAELLRAADETCEHFAFCDGDDAWPPHKLTFAVTALYEVSIADKLPSLYAHRSCLVGS